MKKLARMFIFSALALFLTSVWNKGFVLSQDWKSFVEAAILIMIIYYLVIPVSKIVLLPLNMLTFGLVSLLLYFLLFYFIVSKLSFVRISPWTFSGFSIIGIAVQQAQIGMATNVLLSAFSVSMIINLIEFLI